MNKIIHKAKVLTKQEVINGRSNAYDFIDFEKLETVIVDKRKKSKH